MNGDWSISCADILFEPMKTHAWNMYFAKNVSADMVNNVDQM